MKTHTRYIYIFLFTVLCLGPIYSYAAGCGYLICNPLPGVTSFQVVVSNVIKIVEILLIMATVLYLLYAGLMFVTAKGEPGKLTKARNALLWGLVGAGLILGARVLVTALSGTVSGLLSK